MKTLSFFILLLASPAWAGFKEDSAWSKSASTEPVPVCGSTVTVETNTMFWTWCDNRYVCFGPNYQKYESALYDLKKVGKKDCPKMPEREAPDKELLEYYKQQGESFVPHWIKWKKIPYEIEGWHCVEWDKKDDDFYISNDSRTLVTEIHWAALSKRKCVREVGYRKDGATVWRKP